jgi:hypothetical protein
LPRTPRQERTASCFCPKSVTHIGATKSGSAGMSVRFPMQCCCHPAGARNTLLALPRRPAPRSAEVYRSLGQLWASTSATIASVLGVPKVRAAAIAAEYPPDAYHSPDVAFKHAGRDAKSPARRYRAGEPPSGPTFTSPTSSTTTTRRCTFLGPPASDTRRHLNHGARLSSTPHGHGPYAATISAIACSMAVLMPGT